MEAAGCLSVRAASVKGNRAASLSMLEVQFVGARLLVSVNLCLLGVINRPRSVAVRLCECKCVWKFSQNCSTAVIRFEDDNLGVNKHFVSAHAQIEDVTKVRTDTTISVLQTRYRAKLAGS